MHSLSVGRRLLGAGIAAVAALTVAAPVPASADSILFGFGFSSGGHRDWRRHGPPRHRFVPYRHHRAFRDHGRFYGRVVVVPPPVYAPPPRVVYAPPPAVVYAPPPAVVTVPAPPAPAQQGGYCREYQATVMVAGRPQQTWGTACMQADGSWRIVD